MYTESSRVAIVRHLHQTSSPIREDGKSLRCLRSDRVSKNLESDESECRSIAELGQSLFHKNRHFQETFTGILHTGPCFFPSKKIILHSAHGSTLLGISENKVQGPQPAKLNPSDIISSCHHHHYHEPYIHALRALPLREPLNKQILLNLSLSPLSVLPLLLPL